ncbi:MAG: DUF1292 domain-containing protein [Myxococcota bacterium]
MGENDNGNGLGHVEELDESAELEVVEFSDEEGVTYQAAILAVIQVDDQDYAVLAPIEQLEEDNEGDLELFLFEYGEDDEGNEYFSYIEDEAVFARVQEAAAALLDEGDDDSDEN